MECQDVVEDVVGRCNCTTFVEAQEAGTDHNGDSSAIFREDGGFTVGYKMPLMNYCPWCGKAVPK